MAWTVEAKRYPIDIFGATGHMYIEVFDNNGDRVAQYNGWSAKPDTGEANEYPWDVDENDVVRIYDNEDFVIVGTETATREDHPHDGVVLFSGTEGDVEEALAALEAYKAYVNANSENLTYAWIPGGGDYYNSNSTYVGMVDMLAQLLGIDAEIVDDAKDVGLSNPGIDRDVQKGDKWLPNYDAEGNIVGSIVIDAGGTEDVIGTPGDDVIYAMSGNDIIRPGHGYDVIYGGGGDDTYVLDATPGAVKMIHETDAGGNNDKILLPEGIDIESVEVFQPKLGDLVFKIPDGNGGYLWVQTRDPRLGNGSGVELIQIGDDTPLEIAELPQVQGLPEPASFSPLPDLIQAPLNVFGLASSQSSPLVLDLDGDGVELTTFNPATTTTFFDLDGDGFATQTAWVSEDDALLVRDVNDNGTIDDGTELFGSPTVDGFALLAELDSNGDLLIDAYDADWGDLRIWQDTNSDAVTQEGELLTLASLSIESINLAGVTPSTSTISGNAISHTSTFKYENGSTASIVDAWFVHDKVNSYYGEAYILDVRTIFLPGLRGFGRLPDLHIAMSDDATLLDLTEDFAIGHSDFDTFQDIPNLDDDIAAILYRWAGVDGVNPTSRGPNVDARHLEFLETFFGTDFIQTASQTPNPYEGAGALLEQAWDSIFMILKSHLLAQVGAGQIFEVAPSYDLAAGAVAGDMDLSQDRIDDLEVAASEIGVDARAFWTTIARLIEHTRGIENLTPTELGWLDEAVEDSDPSLTWDYVAYGLAPSVEGTAYSGTSGNDTYTGTIGDDTITGGTAGDDELHGGDGDDVISGGDGNDQLYGDGGNDELISGTGTNTIYGGDGDDTLSSTAGSTNTLYGGNGEDSLSGAGNDDYLDGGSHDDIIYGSAGNDEIYGGSGNDYIEGGNNNDVLSDGSGGDIVISGSGNDTFIYTSGDDLYFDATGTDTIVLPSGLVLGDLTFYRGNPTGSNYTSLIILVDDLGTIEIETFFASSGDPSAIIETLTFADTSTFSLTSFTSLIAIGNDADNFLEGVNLSGEINDEIYGQGGDDTIWGRSGNDVLDGGDGNDTMDGALGNDVYIASAGYDVIWESGGADTIRLPEGYDSGDIHMVRVDTYDLLLTVDGLGQMRVENFYSGSNGIIEVLEFYDTSTLSLTGLPNYSFGTGGNDSMSGTSGSASPVDVFDGREGNDTYNGYAGNDVYYFSAGNDTINETSGSDTVKFRESHPVSSITVYRDGSTNSSKNLVFKDQSGNTLTNTNQFYSNSNQSIEFAVFDDNTTWEFSTIEVITLGSSGNDSILSYDYGDASNADTIYGLGGNDTIQASNGNDYMNGGTGNDTLIGWTGNDTYVYDVNDGGLDTVSESSASGTDKLVIAGGATINDLTVTGISSPTFVISAGVNEISLIGTIETVEFDDGFTAPLAGWSSWFWGTSGNDTITGNGSANVLIGKDGNDTINAGGANDNAHGGAGTDTIHGDAGDDLLHGGAGNDVLYGDDGLDALYGGSGADTFMLEATEAFNNVDVVKDFNIANDNDVLDISDILDATAYNHGVDAITDWVEITTSGSDSLVKIDRDGTGGTYTMTQVATLQSITGLTDEAALVTSGNLLAA